MTSVRVIAIDAAHPLFWIDASIDDQWLVRQLRGSHLQRMFTGTAPCGASRLRQVGQQLTQRNGIRRLQSCIRLNLPKVSASASFSLALLGRGRGPSG